MPTRRVRLLASAVAVLLVAAGVTAYVRYKPTGGPGHSGSQTAGRSDAAGTAPGSTTVTGWRIRSSAQVQREDVVSKVGYDTKGWLPVSPASTVLAGLVENRRYPDLFRGTNLRDTVNPKDFAVPWWYWAEFTLAGRKDLSTLLELPGVISRADVWVNGARIAAAGHVAGAYPHHQLDLTSRVRPGRNVVALKVYPADPDRDLVIGWIDWSQPPPDGNMGLWRDVVLRRTGAVALDHPRVRTRLAVPALDRAELTVKVDVSNMRDAPVTATVDGTIDGARFTRTVPLAPREQRTVAFTPADTPALRLTRPRVWWPVGMGAQPRYELALAASSGKAAGVSDRATVRFGIRDVRAPLTADGHRRFVVNGRPLLIRGGGWSSDLFLRSDPVRLADQIRYVRDLGLNAIRGEGKLETDAFYELTDRYGILVLPGWECCDKWEGWAGDDGGGQQWKAEDYRIAEESLASEARRLANHPSVVAFLIGSDHAPPPEVEQRYLRSLRAADWPNPVIPSAAANTSGTLGPSGMKMTGPYDWVPPDYWYAPREGGAFGFNSETSAGPDIPPLDSLRRMLTPAELEALWREPDTAQFHAGKTGSQFATLEIFGRALAARYGTAASLDDYVRKAQLANYEATRAQFEAYGRNADAARNASTGVIYWMLNSPWTSLHWQLYDRYLGTGGAYFGAKKANEPLHVQYSYDDRSVVVVNRRTQPARGLRVTVRVCDLDGTVRFTRTSTGVDVPAGASRRPFAVPPVPGRSAAYLVQLTLADAAGRPVSRNVYWLSTRPDVLDWDKSDWYYTPVSQYAALSHLSTMPRAHVSATATSSARDHGEVETAVTLRNSSPGKAAAFFLDLTVRGADSSPVQPVLWTDNEVTLFPGETVTVRARYRSADVKGGQGRVRISGWNVSEQTIPAPTG